jgi:chemotaxis response regulator CheB
VRFLSHRTLEKRIDGVVITFSNITEAKTLEMQLRQTQAEPEKRVEWKNRNGVIVVCVGGSAGGLDTYTRFLRHLPADMGVAIVIVNHLRTVATKLHEILPRYT